MLARTDCRAYPFRTDPELRSAQLQFRRAASGSGAASSLMIPQCGVPFQLALVNWHSHRCSWVILLLPARCLLRASEYAMEAWVTASSTLNSGVGVLAS